MKQGITLACVLLCVTAIRLAAAPLNASLISSLQPGFPGQTVTFAASLLNDSPETEYLNGISSTLDAPLSFDASPFFTLTPPSLAPGGTYIGPIFAVFMPPGTPTGVYTGTVDILGGTTAISQDVLARLEFGVQFVPEPGTLMLIVPAVALLALARHRIRLSR